MMPGAPVVHDEDDSLRRRRHHDERELARRGPHRHGHGGGPRRRRPRLRRRPSACSARQHCAIEPHVTVGWLDEDERLVIRTSTQVPFHVRRMLAPLVGLPVKQIRVIKPRIGGGFGGKQEMLIEDIVGHLVLATRRPVRLELSREEEFVGSRTRHAQTLRFRTGVTSDGRLLAQDMSVLCRHGSLRRARLHRELGDGDAGPLLVQLPGQAVQL